MAEDKYPKTIKVNGQEIVVNSKEEEKQARQEAKENNVEVEDISTENNQSGNQSSSTEDATVEQESLASNQEVAQPQNKQQKNMELSSDDGSLELVQSKIENNTATKEEKIAFINNYEKELFKEKRSKEDIKKELDQKGLQLKELDIEITIDE